MGGVSDRWKVTSGRWKVTCDMPHVTYNISHVTKRCLKVQKSVKKEGYLSNGGTFRTRQESHCLLYADFFFVILLHTNG